MAGILTKGIKLSYKKQGSTYEEILQIQAELLKRLM